MLPTDTSKSSIDEYKKIIEKLSADQIPITVQSLKDQDPAILRQKFKILFEKFNESKPLEMIGSALRLEQILFILDIMIEKDIPLWKLSPLFVGMSHELFSQLLFASSASHINILKQEVFTEALQHHLTLMTHEIVKQVPELVLQLDKIEQKIIEINLDDISSMQISSLTNQIEFIANNYQSILEKINKLLSLSWNTHRTDLIEKLSTCKETAHKLINSRIGNSKTPAASSTGLFAHLEQKLSGVFEGFKSQPDVEALKDDEPSIEALVKFSLWYLRDYWEMGLLPSIKNPSDLDIQNNIKTATREELYNHVNENLAKLNLKTVGDLKKHKIFSKATLVEYIKLHQKLLHKKNL